MRLALFSISIALMSATQSFGAVYSFSDPSGLAAEATFTLVNPTTLEVRLRNTSTGVPMGFSNSDQLLTGLSWDFGLPGINAGDPEITGGTIVTGPNSSSINFSITNVGPNTSVGGEWGYGNMNGSGALVNMISGNQSGVTPFGGPNLDGPVVLDGPQAGLVANPILVPLGGLGAIQDEIIATLTISQALNNLDFLLANGIRVEFGSDAHFITIPEPATLGLIAMGGVLMLRRRR